MLESNIIPSCLFSINGFINLNVMNINKKSFLIFLFAFLLAGMYVQQVLYFVCNYTDNQRYTKSGKGKCSQNDTRIVLPMNEEKGCV